jgi:hypothetical protein
MNRDLKADGWNVDTVDNVNLFRTVLQELGPYFKETDEQHFKNLLYISQQNLGLAHCLQHNHMMHVAIPESNCTLLKEKLAAHKYHELVGCYSSRKFTDSTTFNNNQISGVKSWLTNLTIADIAIFSAVDINNEIFDVAVDLSQIEHSIDTVHPDSFGMKMASPSNLIFPRSVPFESSGILHSVNSPGAQRLSNYANFAFFTNHLGIILGLFKSFYHRPGPLISKLDYRLQPIKLEIGALTELWKNNLQYFLISNEINHSSTTRFTQYALAKKVLLDLIYLILEVGIHDFVDPTNPKGMQFADAITFSTHMFPLYKCHTNFEYFHRSYQVVDQKP